MICLYCDRKDDSIFRSTVQEIVATESCKTMIMYPISMLLFWVPSQIFSMYSETHLVQSSSYLIIGNFFYMIAPLNGCMFSIIFYVRTKEAKHEWLNILKNLNLVKQSSDVEMRESTVNAIIIDE